MEIQSGFNPTQAMQQVARSTEMMNQLNRTIVDTAYDTANKMLRVNVEQKVATQQQQQKLDVLA